MLKQATLYRLSPATLALIRGNLEDALSACALRDIGPLEEKCFGFIPPAGEGLAAFTVQVGSARRFAVGGWRKSVPAAAIKALAKKQAREIEQQSGTPLRRAELRRLVDAARTAALAQAIPTPIRIDAYVDDARSLLVVGAGAGGQADTVVSELRRALGSCEAVLLTTEHSLITTMTNWVRASAPPANLQLGDELELRDPTGTAAVIRGKCVDICSDEIKHHVEGDMHATKLGLVSDEALEFVLDQRFVFTKLRAIDTGGVSEAEEDPTARSMADLTLFHGSFGKAYDTLALALGVNN